MPKLPVVSGPVFVKALLTLGYQITNRRGSHVVLHYRAGDSSTAITVPLHRELKKGTLATLLKRNELITGKTTDEMLKLM